MGSGNGEQLVNHGVLMAIGIIQPVGMETGNGLIASQHPT
jgi:hypothetical protein